MVLFMEVIVGLGFPSMLTYWVIKCVSFVSYSLMLNGVLNEPFQGKRGTRLGDPMSLYLFIIALEYL